MEIANRLGLSALALLVFCACQSTPQVKTERLDGARFGDLRSFAFSPALAIGDDPAFGPVARAAAEEALSSVLLPRGLALVDDGTADLLLAVGMAAERGSLSRGSVGLSTPSPGVTTHTTTTGLATPVGTVPLRRSQHHHHHPAPPVAVEQSIADSPAPHCFVVVDAFDADTKRHLWRGSSRCHRWSSDRINLEQLRKRVAAIARELPSD